MDAPDAPRGGDIITLADYAAQHGASYQQVYGWVRLGHISGERHGDRWWVRSDAPRPQVRKGGFDQARRLVRARAAITTEARREAGRRRAAHLDPERRRAIGRRLGTSPTRRRNHGPCAACRERPATVKGRCARCDLYWLYHGAERPPTVPRRGPRGPLGPRRRGGLVLG